MSEQDKKILQIGIFFGLVAAVVLGYWWFFWVKNEMENERNLQTSLKGDLERVDAELLEIELLEEKRPELMALALQVNEVASKLPSSPDAEGFLNNLVETLRKSGVVNRHVARGEPVEYASYTEIPWDVTGVGQYFEFGPFLNMVELNPTRFMRVKSFRVSNDYTLPGYHPLEIEIGTFMFNK